MEDIEVEVRWGHFSAIAVLIRCSFGARFTLTKEKMSFDSKDSVLIGILEFKNSKGGTAMTSNGRAKFSS